MSIPISVLMPVYNAERYVAEAVESILTQTFRDFEFLIIDDGSTDRSLEILRRYEKQDSRIRLISRPNTGYVVALNEMLAMARGEFIARMDADDISLASRFEEQVALLQSCADLVCVGVQYESMDHAGRVFTCSSYPTDPIAIDEFHLARGYAVLHPTWMGSRETLIRLGGYAAEYYPAEDNDLLLKLGEVGTLSNVDKVLFRYRVHDGSVSATNRIRQWDAGNRALLAAWRRRGLTGRPSFGIAPPTISAKANTIYKGWMAWSGGRSRAARYYACRAVAGWPFSKDAWMLAACAWLKDPESRRWFA